MSVIEILEEKLIGQQLVAVPYVCEKGIINIGVEGGVMRITSQIIFYFSPLRIGQVIKEMIISHPGLLYRLWS